VLHLTSELDADTAQILRNALDERVALPGPRIALDEDHSDQGAAADA
jgi:hypothetical protein